MKNKIHILTGLCIWLAACTPTENPTTTEEISPAQALFDYFPERIAGTDTLHFPIENEKELAENPELDSLLEVALPDSLFELAVFGVEEVAKHEPKFRIPLDEQHDACIISSTENWYFQTSMLIYDSKAKAFTGIETLAQFYGGDGGQIATESWLLNGGLYRWKSDRGIRFDPEIDDAVETISSGSQVLKWDGKAFSTDAAADSLALSKQFPMSWEW